MEIAIIINIIDSGMGLDLVCGSCYCEIYGYDEDICPTCGIHINMDQEVKMTQADVEELIALEGKLDGVLSYL